MGPLVKYFSPITVFNVWRVVRLVFLTKMEPVRIDMRFVWPGGFVAHFMRRLNFRCPRRKTKTAGAKFIVSPRDGKMKFIRIEICNTFPVIHKQETRSSLNTGETQSRGFSLNSGDHESLQYEW